MAASQDTELLAAYGEVIFDGHLLEAILKLHLVGCAHFKLNGFNESPNKIKKSTFEELIDFLFHAYDSAAHPDVPKIVKGLHLIRLIRNQLVHGFVLQLHAELHSEEGKDQVLALLRRVSFYIRQYNEGIGKQHRQMFQQILETNFMRIFDHPDEPLPEGRLATSRIQSLLDQFQNLHFPQKDSGF